MVDLFVMLALALLWSFLYGELTVFNMLVGAVLGAVLLSVIRRDREHSFSSRLWGVLRFVAAFLAELAVAGATIARLTLVRGPRFHPHVIAVPLRLESDGAIALLAATITLLPGTVAMGTSVDRRTLYAHAIATADPDEARQSVVRIETLILRFMR